MPLCTRNFSQLFKKFAHPKVTRSIVASMSSNPVNDQENVTGARAVVSALKKQGVQYIFGVVGIPVIEIGTEAQNAGIKFFGMRNEQAASYAASAMGYLTQRPGVCLVVSGPGLVHALAGMANAQINCWPLVVIGGSSETQQESHGAFQELPQVEASRMYCKYAARPSSISTIPFYIEKAFRSSMYGRPGVCYLDLPGNMIEGETPLSSLSDVPYCSGPPKMFADLKLIKKAVEVLKTAERPLVIVGKGAAYSRAEGNLLKLINEANVPFLPTPMGKGVVPDNHDLCISPARSRALLEADVIVLLGARLNWILHFGLPPRFQESVKIIQVDLHPEELHNNVPATVALAGDVDAVVGQLVEEVKLQHWSFAKSAPWHKRLHEKINQNKAAIKEMVASNTEPPMNYYTAYEEIRSLLPPDFILVNEGANTMDIGRSVFMHNLPRHRLDAGTFGTMGVGLGFAIAAAVWCQDHAPDKRVVCIEGDSAFGFSGMEYETMCRYKLPIILIIVNNNGIYAGLDEETWKSMTESSHPALSSPVTSLYPNARYENFSQICGGKGFLATNKEELRNALKAATSIMDQPCIINVLIEPMSQRKSQDFGWLTKSKM